MSTGPIDRYLNQSRVKNTLVEGEAVHVPPSPEEAKQLFAYLKKLGIEAAIVGSVAILHYVKDPEAFRPTVDLDVFVKLPAEQLAKLYPMPGWYRDAEAIGVVSWISPSGGYVDFLTSGLTFPGMETMPRSIAMEPNSKGWPVATAVELFRIKLNSTRIKDVTDLVSLARALKRVPSEGELGSLNTTQRENLGMVQQWFKLRPSGGYGE